MASFTDRFADGPPFRGMDAEFWDEFEADVEAVELILKSQTDLIASFISSASTEPLTVKRIIDIHGQLFINIFPDWSGVLRGIGDGEVPKAIYFGPYTGTPPEAVQRELRTLDEVLRNKSEQLSNMRSTASRAEILDATITVASLVHCELIRIHPFVNGNGRTARMAMTYLFIGEHLPVIPFETDREPYYQAIGEWIENGNITAFEQFLKRLSRNWT